MLTALLRTCVISGLIVKLLACQSKPKSALDRPFVSGLTDPDVNARDMADIQQEHSLDEVRWKHLNRYSEIAPTNRALFLPPGITYRQASRLGERNFFNQQAQDSIARAAKEAGLGEAPPLDVPKM